MAEALFHFIETEAGNDASARNAQRENSSRFASVQCTYESTGVGQSRISAPIIFPVVFKTEPFFTCGSGVIRNPAPNGYNDPIGQSGVYQWEVDERGYFVGAWMWVRISASKITSPATRAAGYQEAKAELDTVRALLTAPAQMKVQHYMSFSAIAIKDIPAPARGAQLQVRTVGI